MSTTRNTKAVALVLGTVMMLALGPAAAVEPVVIEGNPNCTDLHYDFGFKPQPEPPPTGVYTFPDGVHELIITSDGTYFDWQSTLGIDAVIVKGGNTSHLYVYDPPEEAFADQGLSSPFNNTAPYEISHIEVCWDYEVDVEKTAETSFTRGYTWNIDKSVAPPAWSLFDGDQGASVYTVAVDRTVTDSDFAVTGDIVISNATPYAATITEITDLMTGGIAGVVNCGVALPYTLPAWDELSCSYTAELPDGSDRSNTATVRTDPAGFIGGGVATAPVIFGEPTTVIGPETVSVVDSNDSTWSFADDAAVSYEWVFDCASGAGSYPNVATIVETGQSAAASVNVACYGLEVSKTADTAVDRSYIWNVQKWAEDLNGALVEELTLSPGQAFEVVYSVGVEIVDRTDSGFTATGDITVSNPAPISAHILGVSDLLSGALSTDLSCAVNGFPFELPAGGTFQCSYTQTLADGSLQTNTASAELQNYAYGPGGSSPIGTTVYSGSAAVDFSDPAISESIDECVDVSDAFTGPLGTVCFGEVMPVVFDYPFTIGPFFEPEDCGEQVVENIATIVTGDTGAEDDSTWTIPVEVPCSSGCTLTPGYWKTHSIYGPAPYDDTWTAIGEDTAFFYAELEDGSVQSYHEVLWTAPQGGNAYYILAHAYIAAVLNGANGASAPTEIGVTIDLATLWFDTPEHTPAYAANLKGKHGAEERAHLLMLAALLDDYNNGEIGPGHCSE